MLAGHLDGGVEKRRLANSRGPFDQHHGPGVPSGGDRERRLQLSQLSIAFQERGMAT